MMDIKLFDNLRNAFKDNRDTLDQEDEFLDYDRQGEDGYLGDDTADFGDDEGSMFDNPEEQESAAPARRSGNVTLKVVKPTAYVDGPDIADKLMDGSTVVVNLEEMNKENAIRLIDFLLGVAHVLEADMKKVSANTIVIAPGGIEESVYEPENDGYDNE
ncbi:MAG: cell division protein SepF [Clostridia bacterium]|nr:cell division protein SepF [Clostridia bacterium]